MHDEAPATAETVPARQIEQVVEVAELPAGQEHDSESPVPEAVKPVTHEHNAGSAAPVPAKEVALPGQLTHRLALALK